MKLCEYFAAERGRQSKLASLTGISPVLLSQWAGGKRDVPAERCPAIERATQGVVRCEDLRPDVEWGVLRGAAPTAASSTETITAADYVGPERRARGPGRDAGTDHDRRGAPQGV